MLGVCLLIGIQGFTQKANYELAEKFANLNYGSVNNNSLSLYPEFLPDSDKFWYSFRTDEGKKYYLVDPVRKRKQLLFDNDQLLGQISGQTREAYDSKDLSLNGLKFEKGGESFVFQFGKYKYRYNLKSRRVVKYDTLTYDGGQYSWIKYSPDSNYIVFAKNHNLYIMGNKKRGRDTTHIQLTTDGEKYYSYAKEPDEVVDSTEAECIAVWMKDSKKLYAVREDNRKVKDLWVINSLKNPRPELKTYKYAMPGEKELGQSELVVIDMETKKVTKMETARWTDQYLSVIYASKNSDKIYFERRTRPFDCQEVCVADVATGKSKVLIHEEDKPFMDYKMASINILNDGKDILYRSERTGWGHYYLYDGDGNFKHAVTSGGWVAGPVTDIDTMAREVYFYGLGREKETDPYYYVAYKVHIDHPESLTRLTFENATHNVQFSKSHKYFVNTFGRVDQVPRIVLKNAKGKVLMELEKPDIRRAVEMGWKAPERFRVKAADGVTDLYGVMFKPFDFDSTKTYPIISSVYPGPHYEYVPTQFALTHDNVTRLAQLGFIVITVGHRGGTPMRGKYYHTYSHGKLRDYPLADDKYAIEQLADRYPFIDKTRVGIFGHSGGGFMSAAALLTYPDFYKAAVSCSGNHDNSIYNQWWGETHHGVREEKKVIRDSVNGDREEINFRFSVPNNMQLAKNYKGGLLLVHGMMDDNVHPANTLRVVVALIKAGKNFDMIFLPEEDHGYGGAAETFFERKMWFHFAKYLLGDASGDEFYEVKQYGKR